MHRVHVLVSGRVQGVGFRFYTLTIAKRLGIRGYVRNLPDGRVEIVAEGDAERLAMFIDEVRKGSPYAVVADIDVRWEEATGEFSDFYIEF